MRVSRVNDVSRVSWVGLSRSVNAVLDLTTQKRKRHVGYIWIVGEGQDVWRSVETWCGFDPATGKFGPERPFYGCTVLRSGQGRSQRRLEHFPPNVAPPKDKATLARDWCIAACFAIMLLDHLIK
jgi:hypothetical protein